MKSLNLLVALVFLASPLTAQQPPPDQAKLAGKHAEDFPAATKDFFHDMDMIGKPDEDQPATPAPLELTDPDQIRGRNTWVMWCGGNEWVWDWLAQHKYGFLDFLKLVGSPSFEAAKEKTAQHLKETGLINGPGCQPVVPAASYNAIV